MTYKQYLHSEHWRLLRGAKLQIAPMCELCEDRHDLEVRHKIYRASWFDTKIMDLQVLCHDCHILQHAKEWEKIEKPVSPSPVPAKPKEMNLAGRIAALKKSIARKPGSKMAKRKQRRLENLLRVSGYSQSPAVAARTRER